MKSSVKRLSIAIVFLFVAIYIFYHVGLSKYVTLDSLKLYGHYLQGFVNNNYFLSVFIYMLIYFVVIASSIPATAIMSIAGGFLFGVVRCVLYATIASTAGATFSFLLIRFVFAETIALKYADKVEKFRSGLREYGTFYLLILHFLFVLPFALINTLAALAGVSLWQFIWTTAVGFLPAGIIYAFAGKQLRTISSVGDVFSPGIIVVLVSLILFMCLIMLFKRYKKSVGM